MSAERPWYRLHLLTWLLFLCVGASLVVENVASNRTLLENRHLGRLFVSSGSPSADMLPIIEHGWPLPLDNAVLLSFSFPALIFNIATSLFLMAGVGIASEQYLRRQAKWHQFSINFILALTGFVALLCANGMYGWVRWNGEALWEYVPFAFIIFACWCAFWMMWTLMGRAIKRFSEGRADG